MYELKTEYLLRDSFKKEIRLLAPMFTKEELNKVVRSFPPKPFANAQRNLFRPSMMDIFEALSGEEEEDEPLNIEPPLPADTPVEVQYRATVTPGFHVNNSGDLRYTTWTNYSNTTDDGNGTTNW